VRALFLLVLLGSLALAAEEAATERIFTLKDGRTVRGVKSAEDRDGITVEVSVGTASAQIKLGAGEVVSEEAAPVAKAAPSKVTETSAPDADPREQLFIRATEPGENLAAIAGEVLERLDKEADPAASLRLAIAEATREAAQVEALYPFLANPMPQGNDDTYFDLYGPLADGVYAENYQGLVYHDGVIPRLRARLQNLRSYQHFIFDNQAQFTNPALPGTWIYPLGSLYRPFEPLPIPQGASPAQLPLGPNGGYPVAPYYQPGYPAAPVINTFPAPKPIVVKP